MGKTAFSGPVWGAKSLLMSARCETVSTGAGNGISTTVAFAVVPVGEDWYITDFQAFRTSTGSTTYELQLQDDSSKISSGRITSSGANAVINNALAPTGGEYAGVQVLSGSTLAAVFVDSSVTGASSGLIVNVYGYPRFVASSRYNEVQ